MKKKKQILLTCGISIFAFLLLFYFLSQSGKEKMSKIYLINQDISAGSKLVKSMINESQVPISCNLTQAIKDTKDIIGKVCVYDMKKGDLISYKDIVTEGNGIFYPTLEKGKVLYTIALKPDEANGYWLEKGNEILIYIDEIPSPSYSAFEKSTNGNVSADSKGATVNNSNEIGSNSITIERIEKAKIVRIMDESGNESLINNKTPKMVCLELTQEQAQYLFKAESLKKIKLLPQNPE